MYACNNPMCFVATGVCSVCSFCDLLEYRIFLYILQMMFLPNKLSSLPNIMSIHIEGLKLIDPPLFVAQESFQSMKMYMQHQATSNAPWNFLRLMIVGPPSSGKSYLSARLRNVRYQTNPPTKGVQVIIIYYFYVI